MGGSVISKSFMFRLGRDMVAAVDSFIIAFFFFGTCKKVFFFSFFFPFFFSLFGENVWVWWEMYGGGVATGTGKRLEMYDKRRDVIGAKHRWMWA